MVMVMPLLRRQNGLKEVKEIQSRTILYQTQVRNHYTIFTHYFLDAFLRKRKPLMNKFISFLNIFNKVC